MGHPDFVGVCLAGGVVDDNLPALVGFFEDEGEEAFRVAAIFFAAVELIFADADGELFVESVDLELREGEGAHGGLAGVVVAVLFDEAGEAVVDVVGEEDGVGRVLVGVGEGLDVAAIPGGLLCDEDFDDVELLAGGGVEVRGGVLRVRWVLRGGWAVRGCRGILRAGLRSGWGDGEDEEEREQGGEGSGAEFAWHRASPQC